MTKNCKNAIPTELNNLKKNPLKLDQCNDKNNDFEKRRSCRIAATNADLIRRLNENLKKK